MPFIKITKAHIAASKRGIYSKKIPINEVIVITKNTFKPVLAHFITSCSKYVLLSFPLSTKTRSATIGEKN